MKKHLLPVTLALAWLAGCSDGKKDPVPVSGSVKTSSGSPVSGVRLILAPVHGPTTATVGFPLDDAGRFDGQALPGTYTYYLSRAAVDVDDEGRPANAAEAKKLKEANQKFRRIPAAYQSDKGAGPERQVEVRANSSLSITISQ